MKDMAADFIAPCGINCRVCRVHMRSKQPCPGCAESDAHKPRHCVSCAIRLCGTRPAGEPRCDACDMPCRRLKDMDRRYRRQYGVSPLDNLRVIRERGLDAFLLAEQHKWTCPACGGLLCQHESLCPQCGITATEHK